jgi:hypothetical protein
MPGSFSFQKLADGVTRSYQKLLSSVQNPFIKMNQCMLQIMQNKMYVQFVGVCPLSTTTTKIARYLATAIFANDRSIYFMSSFFQRLSHMISLFSFELTMLKITILY